MTERRHCYRVYSTYSKTSAATVHFSRHLCIVCYVIVGRARAFSDAGRSDFTEPVKIVFAIQRSVLVVFEETIAKTELFASYYKQSTQYDDLIIISIVIFIVIMRCSTQSGPHEEPSQRLLMKSDQGQGPKRQKPQR